MYLLLAGHYSHKHVRSKNYILNCDGERIQNKYPSADANAKKI
jgi:hypothetical protein